MTTGEILILGRTEMGKSHHCVGGFDMTHGKAVRLMTREREHQPSTTPFDVGAVWTVDYRVPTQILSPHTEDVLVRTATQIDDATSTVSDALPQMHVWEGDPDELFDGLIGWTSGGSGYISESTGVPDYSVGFWRPERALVKESTGTKYLYEGSGSHLPYKGVAPLLERVEPGTLVRVSLARWWCPEDRDIELRCYLQLSGVFEHE